MKRTQAHNSGEILKKKTDSCVKWKECQFTVVYNKKPQMQMTKTAGHGSDGYKTFLRDLLPDFEDEDSRRLKVMKQTQGY